MRTSQNPVSTMKKTVAVFAAVLAASAILPLAAHADGDSDREQIAEFYANLDQRRTTPELEPAAPASVLRLSYIKAVRPTHKKRVSPQPKTTVEDTLNPGRRQGVAKIAWFNSSRPGYVRMGHG
jgi:hypothetical protein